MRRCRFGINLSPTISACVHLGLASGLISMPHTETFKPESPCRVLDNESIDVAHKAGDRLGCSVQTGGVLPKDASMFVKVPGRGVGPVGGGQAGVMAAVRAR